MSILSDLNNAVSTLTKLSVQVKASFKKKRATASLADNTSALGGYTKSTLDTLLQASEVAHEARTDNPHGLTAADINTYATTDINNLIGNLMPTGILPLSSYGSPDYLPPIVSGSFEGATANLEQRTSPLKLEDDDTLVYLRNGTNGSTRGVYYAYLKNASKATDLSPTYTNWKYAPSFFPANQSAAHVYANGDGAFAGRLQDATGALQGCFIAVTNGSMDQAAHKGILVSADYAEALKRGALAVLNQYVYLIVPMDITIMTPNYQPIPSNQQPLAFQVYRWNLGSFVASNPATINPDNVSNWTTSGFYETVTATNIQLASRQWSTSAADKPFILSDGGSLAWPYFGAAFPTTYARVKDGNIRVFFSAELFGRYDDSGVAGSFVQVLFSLLLSPGAMTARLDVGAGAGTPIKVLRAANKTVTITGSPVRDINNLYGTNLSDARLNLLVAENGFEFALLDNYYADRNNRLVRRQISGFTTAFDALNTASYPDRINNVVKGFLPTYGSALGGQLRGPSAIPGNKMLVYAQGAKADGTTRTGLALAKVGAASQVNYQSLNYGSISGFLPDADRKMLSDMGLDDSKYFDLLAEVTSSGISTSGTILVEGYRPSNFLTVDTNLNTSGSVSLTQAQFTALKEAIFTATGLGRGEKQSVMEVHIPQNTQCVPYGAMHVWTSDDKWVVVIVQLNLSARSGAIATVSLNQVLKSYVSTTNYTNGVMGGFGFGNTNPDLTASAGGHYIYQGSDAYLYLGHTSVQALIVGQAWLTLDFRFASNSLTDGSPAMDTFNCSIAGTQADVWRPFSWPGFGVGYIPVEPKSDSYTKLILIPVGTTKAALKSWTGASQGSWRVMASQDVAQGWNVYFTQPVPLIMNGKAYTLGITNINLSTVASPANKTFYMYVRMVNGKPKYVISDTQTGESELNMFIGTIVTGNSGINQINVQKVVRLAGFRISAVAAGSAIPVSSGSPTVAAKLNWV